MRLVSLLSIAAATTFAALTFFGPPASACGNLRGAKPIPPVKDQLVAFREYSRLFTIFPHFGLLQPEGTQPVYKNDTHGRVKGINFVSTKGVAVLKAQFEYRPVPNTPRPRPKYSPPLVPEHTQILYAILRAYSGDGGSMLDYAYIRFSYDNRESPYESLAVSTPRGTARTNQPQTLYGGCYSISEQEESLARSIAFPGEKREGDLDDEGAISLELPNQSKRRVWLGQSWNNDKISIMPASTINNL
ncbi:hypothetical protein THASP1DRAFT_25285 [Thamnocephalis sphaerospora]|uniref:Uncharacterized protein n=1 Tax=Thamnocephalis sphaerospora TaxID=78915 RepID=A0A4P9XKP4_9FUNG|nr:hypothetical protein THASP1DRAFT_25285 [Thamnocephalis sphaerospora]|eukprot:RKP06378.1 hypothetical protein THASP1DRAFT_25285 [Thamnocephalis sphaerospora]